MRKQVECAGFFSDDFDREMRSAAFFAVVGVDVCLLEERRTFLLLVGFFFCWTLRL